MAEPKDAKGRLLQEIEGLSEERINVLADFAAFLKEREEWAETLEVLGDAELGDAIQKSREAWAQGRRAEFVTLADLKQTI